ncbi:pyruvate decarboxylase isozyme [Salix suchowensis]|nr:pyruvate decarboxylase isozyme [Salix suchowensis]
MVQKLEAIRVGTTGAIGDLMTRELESIKPSSQASESNQDKSRTIPVSVPCKKSLDEASSSGCSSGMNRRSPETPQKMKSLIKKNTHHMPMLGSDNITLDRTPRREKSDKKATNIMEIVDVKCGNPDRSWANPITSNLKKLGFSKLSESTV